MAETIKCICGAEPQAILAKQQYSNGVSQNMFSAFEKTKDRKQLIPLTVLNGVTISKLWEAVFSNKSDFLERYHDRRKGTDLEVGKWDYSSDMGSGYRTVSLTIPIDVPKAGSCTLLNEVHRFAYTSPTAGNVVLLYQISSQTPNVTGGQSFRTETFLEITANTVDSECSISVWGSCKKMSFAFSAIQYVVIPRAIREMTAAYKTMIELMFEDLIGRSVDVVARGEEEEADPAKPTDSIIGSFEGFDHIQNTMLQGILLLLAFVVAVALLFSISTLRRTSHVTSLLTTQAFEGVRAGAGQCNFPVSQGVNQAASEKATEPLLTQDNYLRRAAVDAHIHSLRYRLMEQRVAISDIEFSIERLWWMYWFQLLCVLALTAKVFFF